MSIHRHRGRVTRADRQAQEQADETRVEIADLVTELRALWLLMPHALARDSAGLLNDDRHASGARDGSPSPANSAVLEATVMIEAGAHDVAAQAAALLTFTAPLDTFTVLGELPTWHERLSRLGHPLARHLRSDLVAWVGAARSAVGTRHRDYRMTQLCPDHRDTTPTHLRQVGAVATIAPSLLAGPPPRDQWRPILGAWCARACEHESCARILERRHTLGPGPRWSDWILDHAGAPRWRAMDKDDHAFAWSTSRTIRCPKCRTEWTTTTERRVLARRLAELGDTDRDAAALIT